MSKKQKWFATISCGNGMTTYRLTEVMKQEEAESWAREECVEWAESFGYYQDVDFFGDYDQLCKEDSWDEDEESYSDVSELEYWVVDYDPEVHEGYLTY